jgi:5'-nucleotidase
MKQSLILLLTTALILLRASACNAATDHVSSEIRLREQASQPVVWQSTAPPGDTVDARLLVINDFHSQITGGQHIGGRPVGSAPVLASYLRRSQFQGKGTPFLLHAGDHIGASQPSSALLQDEPGMMFFNMLGNEHCRPGGKNDQQCNLIGIPGNHELDEGVSEMLRMIHGGNHNQGPFLKNPYQGAAFSSICANLIDSASGQPLFPPYVVRMVDGVPIGFIGAILRTAHSFVPPQSLAGLKVLDEAEAINHSARQLKEKGVHTLVVLIHQGGYQVPPSSRLQEGEARLVGDIVPILSRLDGEIDVVACGHTHTYHNTLFKNAGGREMLVVQAWPKGTGFADIHLAINRASGEVAAMDARIITTWADTGPGLHPDPSVAAMVQQAETMGNAIAREVIAEASIAITRRPNAAGESALGDLIADAQRQAMGTDFAFMHLEGIASDIEPGAITKADHYTVHPANLNLIKVEMTGAQIYTLLNQQWNDATGTGRFLQVSGLQYIWDAHRPAGHRIVAVMKNDLPLRKEAMYTVTINEYLAGGGEHFTVLTQARNHVVGPFAADALQDFFRSRPQPLHAGIEGRISRIN